MRTVILLVLVFTPCCGGDATEKNDSWPFEDPKSVAVFTTKSVASGAEPILAVYHDSDDGAWQFIGAEDASEENGSLVSLQHVVNLDPSVAALADLPLGWRAWRESKGSPWRRGRTP